MEPLRVDGDNLLYDKKNCRLLSCKLLVCRLNC